MVHTKVVSTGHVSNIFNKICWPSLLSRYLDRCSSISAYSATSKWATTWQNVSSGVSDQARLEPACTATEAGHSNEISAIESRDIILSSEQQRCWSDSADAQADLRLCCSHMTYDTFSHGPAQMDSISGSWIKVVLITIKITTKILVSNKNKILSFQLLTFYKDL